MSTTLAREEASGRTTRATPSFGVRASTLAGEFTFHEWPITESRARWRASILLDPSRIVTVETFDPHDGYRIVNEEVLR